MNVLSVRGLTVRYGEVAVVEGVNLEVSAGSTHGLVGESGSGKSSLARGVVGLQAADGTVLVDGVDVSCGRPGMRGVQMVFQNPYASLNPRMRIGEMIAEAAAAHGEAARPQLLLEMVGLPSDAVERYPHQFSGGQRQRIAIARALATRARLIILDEVTSALDVSVQATILNLLRELQKRYGIAFLFISHDLAVVRYMSETVSVMYAGRIIECAPATTLFAAPAHPYTKALIDSVPRLGGLRAR